MVGDKIAIFRVISSCLLVLSFSCQKESRDYFGSTVPKHPPNELWINNSTELEWLDPGKATGVPEGQILQNIFAGLVSPHPKTLEPIPELAKRWVISDNGKKYTFYLRKSVWNDGTPLTAHDFEYSWKRAIDPRTIGGQYASLFYPIVNAQAFNQKALVVSGLAKNTDADVLRKRFSKYIPVDEVHLDALSRLATVYVGGNPKDKAEYRNLVLRKLNGSTIAGQKIRVKVADSSIVGIRATSDYTLEVQLNSPVPYFLDLPTHYTFFPVPRHLIERLKANGINPDLWTRKEHIVSNGAYSMKEWKFRQHYIFEKNPNYWDVGNVRTNRIKILMIESYNTGLNFYRSGEVDWTGAQGMIPAEYLDHLSHFKDAHNDAYMGNYYYMVNTKKPPFDDVKVRRALSLSIDRESLCRNVTRGGQVPTASLVPDGLAGYQAPKLTLFDLETARELLAKAGYPAGKGFPESTLLYNTTEQHRQVAEAIQQMWKKNLGIHVELQNQEWKVYLKNRELFNYDVARAGWIGDYPDPTTFLDLLSKYSGNNQVGWENDEYDRLLATASKTQDRKRRLMLLRQAEELMLKDQPLIPLFVYTKTYMRKPYLKGFWPNYQDRHDWKYFWIDKRWYQGIPTTPIQDEPPKVAWAQR